MSLTFHQQFPRNYCLHFSFVVSVDVWDGPEMPIVYHGNTLTSKIAFSDVVSVIAQFAFEASKLVLFSAIRLTCMLYVYLLAQC